MAKKSKQKLRLDDPTQQLVKRLWKGYVIRHSGKIAFGVACMLVVGLCTGSQAKMLEPAINKVLRDGDATLAWVLPLAFLGIAVLKGFASYGQAVMMQRMGLRVIEQLQNEMFDRLMQADLAYLHRDATGVLIARFTNDVHLLRDAVVKSFTGIGRDLITITVLAGVMIQTHWKLALASLIVFPLTVVPIVYIGRRLRRISANTQETIGYQTGLLDEVFKGIRQVKAYGMEDYERGRAATMFGAVFSHFMKAGEMRSRSYPILESLGGVAAAIILGWAGWQVVNGAANVNQIDAGKFIAFFTALLLAYQPMRSLANLNASLQQGLAAAQRVFDILDYTPEIVDPPKAPAIRVDKGKVKLDGVGFAYGENAPAVSDIDIIAPPGQTIALVGPSGAGKSTILNLIPRFYDVSAGRILIDGQDIRDVSAASLRKSIALVSQDVTLFNDTVRANIAYGRMEASDDEIAAAAEAAAADGFILDLPQGYDTQVGERGLRLSGGQRQRISIARAMLRNAPILLLDEATSALDSESERQVQAALNRLMHGRTTVVIAHRLSTVMNADRIYVLDKGRIVEQGTHGELFALGGLYAKLCRMQFEDRPVEQEAPRAGAGSGD